MGWRQKWKRKTTLSSSIPSSSFRRHICCYTSSAEGSKGGGGGESKPWNMSHLPLFFLSFLRPKPLSLPSLFFHALGPLRECSNGGLIRRRRSDDICPHHPASPPPQKKALTHCMLFLISTHHDLSASHPCIIIFCYVPCPETY